MSELTGMGLDVTQIHPGIYYVTGNVQFPTQIVVTSRLDLELHRWFKVLTKRLSRVDTEEFVKATKELTEPGDKNNADAVFEVSATANRDLYPYFPEKFRLKRFLLKKMEFERRKNPVK